MLKSTVVSVKELTAPQIDIMYSIMETYYANTTCESFIAALKEKQDAVLLLDENAKICGFTTLAIFHFDENTQLLYSGDTIVEQEFWGRHNLSFAWIENALKHAEGFSGTTYWFLLSKGYKTYKYLHTFFNKYYPCVDTKTSPKIQRIMDTFAQQQYGDKYVNGVWKAGNDYLKGEYDSTSDAANRDKNTAFFLKNNPGYASGDELICLCEINISNLNKFGRRVLGIC